MNSSLPCDMCIMPKNVENSKLLEFAKKFLLATDKLTKKNAKKHLIAQRQQRSITTHPMAVPCFASNICSRKTGMFLQFLTLLDKLVF